MSVDTIQDLGSSEAQSPGSVKPNRAGTRGHKTDGTPWLHPMTFRASAQDRDRIEKRAAKAGLPLSTYVRQSALKTRIVNAKGQSSLTAADLALVQAMSAVGITLAKELPRVGKPHALPHNLAEATTQLSQVLDELRTMIRSRSSCGTGSSGPSSNSMIRSSAIAGLNPGWPQKPRLFPAI